jgi:uncharacterized protein
MMLRWLALCTFYATPLHADVAEAVDQYILPSYAAFADATKALDAATKADCAAPSVIPAYQAAFDAWLGVSLLRFGPAEIDGRSLAIQFWPDPKSLGPKAQDALLRAQDKAVLDPTAFAQVSVAARGLMSLERLLYPADPLPEGDYPCALIRATASDLARLAVFIQNDWQTDFAAALKAAGATGNTRYTSQSEARQALYTALITGFEFVGDDRIGRPLGTFDKPRPERAEAHASGRSLRNVTLSLTALHKLAKALTPNTPATDAAFAQAFNVAAKVKDPIFADVATPEGWLKAQILQQAIWATRDAAIAEIGAALDVGVGFNAADGD